MKNFLRTLVFIPASLLVFGIVLFLGMLIFDFAGKLLNFTSTLGGLINNRNSPNNGSGITMLISVGISGFFAALAYFAFGKWILPDFNKSIHRRIGLYILTGVLGILLIIFTIVGFTNGEVIQAVSLIILLLELIFVFIIFKDDI